jgi:hypothetical protein
MFDVHRTSDAWLISFSIILAALICRTWGRKRRYPVPLFVGSSRTRLIWHPKLAAEYVRIIIGHNPMMSQMYYDTDFYILNHVSFTNRNRFS